MADPSILGTGEALCQELEKLSGAVGAGLIPRSLAGPTIWRRMRPETRGVMPLWRRHP